MASHVQGQLSDLVERIKQIHLAQKLLNESQYDNHLNQIDKTENGFIILKTKPTQNYPFNRLLQMYRIRPDYRGFVLSIYDQRERIPKFEILHLIASCTKSVPVYGMYFASESGRSIPVAQEPSDCYFMYFSHIPVLSKEVSPLEAVQVNFFEEQFHGFLPPLPFEYIQPHYPN